MATLTPTTIDAFYGPDAHQRYDHYKNPRRLPDGNPLFIYRHGGGWRIYDKRRLSPDSTDESNVIATALLGSEDVPFDVISIETRQARWDTPISTAGFGYNEACTVPTYFPDSWNDYKRAILHIKANAQTLGINPNKIIAGGTSAGACIALWSQVTEPMRSDFLQVSSNVRTVGTNLRAADALSLERGLDSRVRGVWYHTGLPDFRKFGSVETVTGSNWYEIYGVGNTTAHAALSAAAREAISVSSYIERGTPYWVPTYAFYLTTRKSFANCAYDAAAGTLTANAGTPFDANNYPSYQAGDIIVTGIGSTAITGRTSDTIITVAANSLGTSNVSVVGGEIFLGKPYGNAAGRDVHAQEQGEELARLCTARGYDFGLEIASTFKAAPSVAWMKSLVR